MTDFCHCGKPLHYTDPEVEKSLHELVDKLGPFVPVTDPNGRVWNVQRHYIALHGIKGADISTLGFREIKAYEGKKPVR